METIVSRSTEPPTHISYRLVLTSLTRLRYRFSVMRQTQAKALQSAETHANNKVKLQHISPATQAHTCNRVPIHIHVEECVCVCVRCVSVRACVPLFDK